MGNGLSGRLRSARARGCGLLRLGTGCLGLLLRLNPFGRRLPGLGLGGLGLHLRPGCEDDCRLTTVQRRAPAVDALAAADEAVATFGAADRDRSVRGGAVDDDAFESELNTVRGGATLVSADRTWRRGTKG